MGVLAHVLSPPLQARGGPDGDAAGTTGTPAVRTVGSGVLRMTDMAVWSLDVGGLSDGSAAGVGSPPDHRGGLADGPALQCPRRVVRVAGAQLRAFSAEAGMDGLMAAIPG